ncbi:acyl-CoA dehydrogenase family protein [Bacillus sp. B15-48]|uniref:acyl-CoA dehydrogenase family protein n=1 Tax=Bacillus sp. B15-48 TaxID=1548601 RepID=UPI00193EEB62|nr:acyl-CoA dehydrogenase family protein [Bacillus sp. B15-48]MBM4764285.1 acyl-CoA dehydrogenase [Bacillus sp. B15-48]
MDYSRTEEQELLMESVREWVARYLPEEVVRKSYEDYNFPDEVYRSYLDAGFGYMGLPEELGGTPTDVQTLVTLVEESTRAAGATLPFFLGTLTMHDMCEFGNEEQVKFVMDKYQESGRCCLSIAISEPGAGSDNSGMTTTVKRLGNGKVVINGQKTFVTNGEINPYVLVIAKDEDPSPSNRSMSMFFLSKDTPGVKTAPLPKIGQKTIPFCEMYFDNVELDESAQVGETGKGFINLMKNFEIERLLVAAHSLGLAQAAMEDAAAYANERVAFGKTIGSFQQIQEMLTDMEIKLQTMRHLLYSTAWKMDNDIPVRLDSALVKRYVCRASTEVASDAMQIFGGIGYTTESRTSRFWEDCRGNQFAGGTDQIMVYIAGRQIVKKYAK